MITGELEAALEACAEHERLSRRLETARAAEASARDQAQATAALVRAEEQDVGALESLSPTRIWATLRGTRVSELERERVELAAQQFRAATAATALAAASSARRELASALGALGDVAARRERALASEEARVHAAGGSTSAQLLEVAEQLASVRAQLREVAEAKAAEQVARRLLQDAADLLGGAGGWASYDTFLGGGLITDLVKYDKMDAATKRLREADAALRRFSAELADVGLSALGGIEVTELDRMFDVWFDNIFSDWAVLERVTEAAERTQRARAALETAAARLQQRQYELEALLATLAQARERLILDR